MKKILAILLAALMLFSCAALAETVKFNEGSPDFDIFVEIDDDVDHMLFESKGGIPMGHFQKKSGGAHLFVDVMASETLDGNLKDLSEEERTVMIDLLSMDFGSSVEVTTETTPKGNMYFHFHDTEASGIEMLKTLYAGHYVTFTLFPVEGTALTEADHEFMMQLFYAMDIVKLAE